MCRKRPQNVPKTSPDPGPWITELSWSFLKSWRLIFEVLEAYRVHGKAVQEHSSKSTKYELEGSYVDPLYEHFRLWRWNKRAVANGQWRMLRQGQGQGQGQDQKLRQRSALQQQMVLALTLTLVLVLTLPASPPPRGRGGGVFSGHRYYFFSGAGYGPKSAN